MRSVFVEAHNGGGRQGGKRHYKLQRTPNPCQTPPVLWGFKSAPYVSEDKTIRDAKYTDKYYTFVIIKMVVYSPFSYPRRVQVCRVTVFSEPLQPRGCAWNLYVSQPLGQQRVGLVARSHGRGNVAAGLHRETPPFSAAGQTHSCVYMFSCTYSIYMWHNPEVDRPICGCRQEMRNKTEGWYVSPCWMSVNTRNVLGLKCNNNTKLKHCS